MFANMINQLCTNWEKLGNEQRQLITNQVLLSCDDTAKISALAEVYGLSKQQLISSLLHSTLLEIEQTMPYKAGDKVIRIEENEPIYEDVGPMPGYLHTKNRIYRELKTLNDQTAHSEG